MDKVGTELHGPPTVPCWLKNAQNTSYREGKTAPAAEMQLQDYERALKWQVSQ